MAGIAVSRGFYKQQHTKPLLKHSTKRSEVLLGLCFKEQNRKEQGNHAAKPPKRGFQPTFASIYEVQLVVVTHFR